jgi:hypothetical protein
MYIQYSTSFIFLSLVVRIEPKEVLLFPDRLMASSNECHQLSLHMAPPELSSESRSRAIIFKCNIQTGILFHTLLDKASHSLILCYDPADETKHVLLF